jgi:hypothetical protein
MRQFSPRAVAMGQIALQPAGSSRCSNLNLDSTANTDGFCGHANSTALDSRGRGHRDEKSRILAYRRSGQPCASSAPPVQRRRSEPALPPAAVVARRLSSCNHRQGHARSEPCHADSDVPGRRCLPLGSPGRRSSSQAATAPRTTSRDRTATSSGPITP